MEINCTLKSERILPSELKKLLTEYYSSLMEVKKENGVKERWQDILSLPSVVCYKVLIEDVLAGWVIVNTHRCTIVELFLLEGYHDREIETLVLEKVVELHKLIAVELPKADHRRYALYKKYGLRPTREFNLHGIPMVKMDLSTAVYLEKLKVMKRPAYHTKEVVVLEKVASEQTEGAIAQGLKNLIDGLGGIGKFVKNGQSVVLKPNIVSEHGLRDGVRRGGIATDIRLISAVVDLLSPVAGEIIIAEGSSINRSETMKMFVHYGFDKIAECYPGKVRLVDLNADECVEKDIPGGRRLETRNIPKTLIDADVIINMPVLKLHFAAGASLSIKNLQGAIPPLEKYKVHFFGLWQNLINTYKLIIPDLIIMDGLFGQEDFGPVSGSPRKMDLLIGGINPVAVDTVALKIMGLNAEDSPPVFMASHEGLGPCEWSRIDVKGAAIEEVSYPFKRPLINLQNGRCIKVHDGGACPGCMGYLHFVLNKLRRPDPLNEGQLLIDRSFEKNISVFIGPHSGDSASRDETNIYMGMCQYHHAERSGVHLPGCPPHAEEIINGIFQFYQDIERPQYADKTEEAKLGELLKSVLASQQ